MRMKHISLAAGAVLLATAATAPVFAHHSFGAEFDANKPVKFAGTVVEFQWVNPHSWLIVDVTEGYRGQVQPDRTIVWDEEPDPTLNAVWRAEGGAPSPLLRRGWTRDSLPAGTRVTLEGFQARDGDTRMNTRDVTFPDGRVMFFGSTGTGAPYEEERAGE
jgi:hypothetical protein